MYQLADDAEVSRAEIRAALEFLKCDNGKITIGGLKNRLQTLFPDLTAKEYRYLLEYHFLNSIIK